ncbi:MAG: hypothetical protein MK193_14195 [Lentisphaeria bacterium]|nr:hypothetical protein [Lentisphaeria bacterium]
MGYNSYNYRQSIRKVARKNWIKAFATAGLITVFNSLQAGAPTQNDWSSNPVDAPSSDYDTSGVINIFTINSDTFSKLEGTSQTNTANFTWNETESGASFQAGSLETSVDDFSIDFANFSISSGVESRVFFQVVNESAKITNSNINIEGGSGDSIFEIDGIENSNDDSFIFQNNSLEMIGEGHVELNWANMSVFDNEDNLTSFDIEDSEISLIGTSSINIELGSGAERLQFLGGENYFLLSQTEGLLSQSIDDSSVKEIVIGTSLTYETMGTGSSQNISFGEESSLDKFKMIDGGNLSNYHEGTSNLTDSINAAEFQMDNANIEKRATQSDINFDITSFDTFSITNSGIALQADTGNATLQFIPTDDTNTISINQSSIGVASDGGSILNFKTSQLVSGGPNIALENGSSIDIQSFNGIAELNVEQANLFQVLSGSNIFVGANQESPDSQEDLRSLQFDELVSSATINLMNIGEFELIDLNPTSDDLPRPNSAMVVQGETASLSISGKANQNMDYTQQNTALAAFGSNGDATISINSSESIGDFYLADTPGDGIDTMIYAESAGGNATILIGSSSQPVSMNNELLIDGGIVQTILSNPASGNSIIEIAGPDSLKIENNGMVLAGNGTISSVGLYGENLIVDESNVESYGFVDLQFSGNISIQNDTLLKATSSNSNTTIGLSANNILIENSQLYASAPSSIDLYQNLILIQADENIDIQRTSNDNGPSAPLILGEQNKLYVYAGNSIDISNTSSAPIIEVTDLIDFSAITVNLDGGSDDNLDIVVSQDQNSSLFAPEIYIQGNTVNLDNGISFKAAATTINIDGILNINDAKFVAIDRGITNHDLILGLPNGLPNGEFSLNEAAVFNNNEEFIAKIGNLEVEGDLYTSGVILEFNSDSFLSVDKLIINDEFLYNEIAPFASDSISVETTFSNANDIPSEPPPILSLVSSTTTLYFDGNVSLNNVQAFEQMDFTTAIFDLKNNSNVTFQFNIESQNAFTQTILALSDENTRLNSNEIYLDDNDIVILSGDLYSTYLSLNQTNISLYGGSFNGLLDSDSANIEGEGFINGEFSTNDSAGTTNIRGSQGNGITFRGIVGGEANFYDKITFDGLLAIADNSIGKISIFGDASFTSDNTLQIDVASNNYDQILVEVDASLQIDGTLSIKYQNYNPQLGDEIRFIVAETGEGQDGEITGQFSNVISDQAGNWIVTEDEDGSFIATYDGVQQISQAEVEEINENILKEANKQKIKNISSYAKRAIPAYRQKRESSTSPASKSKDNSNQKDTQYGSMVTRSFAGEWIQDLELHGSYSYTDIDDDFAGDGDSDEYNVGVSGIISERLLIGLDYSRTKVDLGRPTRLDYTEDDITVFTNYLLNDRFSFGIFGSVTWVDYESAFYDDDDTYYGAGAMANYNFDIGDNFYLFGYTLSTSGASDFKEMFHSENVEHQFSTEWTHFFEFGLANSLYGIFTTAMNNNLDDYDAHYFTVGNEISYPILPDLIVSAAYETVLEKDNYNEHRFIFGFSYLF